jgi:hypothetical protein
MKRNPFLNKPFLKPRSYVRMACDPTEHHAPERWNTLLKSYLIVSRKMGRRLKNLNVAPYERLVRKRSSVVPNIFQHEPLRYEGFAKYHKG